VKFPENLLIMDYLTSRNLYLRQTLLDNSVTARVFSSIMNVGDWMFDLLQQVDQRHSSHFQTVCFRLITTCNGRYDIFVNARWCGVQLSVVTETSSFRTRHITRARVFGTGPLCVPPVCSGDTAADGNADCSVLTAL
jgi:hypothetical protein